MEWLRRAAQLQSSNHWYQYFLAYLEDKAGSVDEALRDYSIAIAHRPDSPWVRFSRARLYRSKGRWDIALEDMQSALEMLSGRPEAAKIKLELGYLYYELGDFARARREYDDVIALGPSGPLRAGRPPRIGPISTPNQAQSSRASRVRFDSCPKTLATRPPASAGHFSS